MFRIAKHLMRGLSPSSSLNDVIDVSEINGVRALHLGSRTVQSAMRIRDPFALELTYTRAIMCFLLFHTSPRQMVTVGLGGGSVPKYVYAHCPEIKSKVIEINPRIIQVARSQFHVPEDDERFEVIEADGLAYLARNEEVTDVLLIDAFDRNGIPPDFCSQDFFDQCANVLKPDGIFVINLWGSDKNFSIYSQRIETSFGGRVLMLPTGAPGNIAVFAFRSNQHHLRISNLRQRAKELEQVHSIEFLEFLEKMVAHNPGSQNRLFMKSDC
ncbi:MAG: polyamine aminopropyltransferase [Betaproteobacteria bacterium]|nr:polyamine aminopropyltransferase [Betaproteobacteria bacterium]